MDKILFEGCAPAIVTPFRNGEVDFDALGKIIDYQLEGGIRAFVVLGSTGEASTLSFAEEDEIIRFAKERIGNRATIIIGTGSNETAKAIKRSKEAKEKGADGLLVVTPYYNKCTQKGLVAHYNAVADAVKMPIIAYNVPARTGLNMNVETVLELAKNPYIVGLKEASGNISQIIQLAKSLKGKMSLYSGDDSLDYLFLTLGAAGMISVTANVLPAQKVALYEAVKNGNHKRALELHDELLEINNALFCEVSPIPIKAALHHVGLCSDEMRMPLTTIEPQNRERVIRALREVSENVTY